MKAVLRFKGGAGSGNFGHAGRPGKQGGSAPKGGRGVKPSEPISKRDEEIQLRINTLRDQARNPYASAEERRSARAEIRDLQLTLITTKPSLSPSEPKAKPVSASAFREISYEDGIRKGIPSFILNENYNLERHRKEPNVFTFAKEYFYGSDSAEGALVTRVQNDLKGAGYNVDVLGSGNHWHSFVGGAGTFSPKSSFVYVVVKVTS